MRVFKEKTERKSILILKNIPFAFETQQGNPGIA